MTNEQLLIQIGRLMGETVREAVQESEERMKAYMDNAVHASEERMKAYVDHVVHASEARLSKQISEVDQRLSEQISEVDQRLSAAINGVHETVRQSLDYTERIALQIAATVDRIERIEGYSTNTLH